MKIFRLAGKIIFTIRSFGLRVFLQKALQRFRLYLGKLTARLDEAKPRGVPKSMVMKTYVPLTAFVMKADQKIISGKLKDILGGISEQ